LTKASMVDGRPEAGILPAGQVAGVIGELPTVKDLLARIMQEAEETLERLAARPTERREHALRRGEEAR
jgi:NAD(P)H-dependent flavin oxidoreductase YrpB (nitropropane dioxygenase family)